jgi:hypothetical protein
MNNTRLSFVLKQVELERINKSLTEEGRKIFSEILEEQISKMK